MNEAQIGFLLGQIVGWIVNIGIAIIPIYIAYMAIRRSKKRTGK